MDTASRQAIETRTTIAPIVAVAVIAAPAAVLGQRDRRITQWGRRRRNAQTADSRKSEDKLLHLHPPGLHRCGNSTSTEPRRRVATQHRDRNPEEAGRWTVEDATVNGKAKAGIGPCKGTAGNRYKVSLVL
jgi:hypothetical protein